MASLLRNISSRFTPTQSTTNLNKDGFSTAKKGDELFTKTDPAVDGDECLHECESCTIKFPRKFEVDEEDNMYGNIGGWNTHMIVATGKSDWVRDIADEKGSVMQAVDKCNVKPTNGKMMLSASNMPIPRESHHDPEGQVRTTVILLPAFKVIHHVTPSTVPDLIEHCVNTGPTNISPLAQGQQQPSQTETSPSLPSGMEMKDCPHKYLILLCSHGTRDARCGQSAPLLRREFERQLRPLGLYRDLEDERPGGVGIYFINHVGGHKYAANVLIYRRDGTSSEDEASQCIWLARVKPSDCENLVRYTILQGKVVQPDRQLRGGFDRSKQLISW